MILIIGTSNSIIQNGYTAQIKDVKVSKYTLGDVSSGGLINRAVSAWRQLWFTDVSHIIIESFVNDYYSCKSKRYQPEQIYKDLSILVKEMRTYWPNIPITIFDIYPPCLFRHNKSELFQLFAIERYKSALHQQDKIYHLTYISNIQPEISKDTFHCIENDGFWAANKLTSHLNKVVTITSSSINSIRATSSFSIFASECHMKSPTEITSFETGLLAGNGLPIYKNSDIYIESKSGIMGLTYKSSLTRGFFCITDYSNNLRYYFSSASSYPKSVIRFVRLPKETNKFCIKYVSILPEGQEVLYIKQSNDKINVSQINTKSISPEEEHPLIHSFALNEPQNTLDLSIENKSFQELLIGKEKNSSSIQNKELFYTQVPKLKINVENFWPNFNFLNDPRFSWLTEYFDIEVMHENYSLSDITLASVFSDPLKWSNIVMSAKSHPTILYTAEHDQAGLPGKDQVNNIFYTTLSHYRHTHSKNIWLPNIVGRLGWDLTQYVNSSYANNKIIKKERKCLFVYSSGLCQFRQKLAELLENSEYFVSAGKLQNNQNGFLAPRDWNEFIDYSKQFTHYIALENTVSQDYMTEKIFTGLCAGNKVFYRGDPSINSLIDSSITLNINNMNPKIAKNFILDEVMNSSYGKEDIIPCKKGFEHELRLSKSKILSLFKHLA